MNRIRLIFPHMNYTKISRNILKTTYRFQFASQKGIFFFRGEQLSMNRTIPSSLIISLDRDEWIWDLYGRHSVHE